MKLRPYQNDLVTEIDHAWSSGHKNVLAVLATGGGKTVIFSTILARLTCACVAIAHRSELVTQMSLTLARNGVMHRVIGPASLNKACVHLHISELKRSFIDQTSRCAVASVDTLVKRDPAEPWFKEVQVWITDEAAHLVCGNKWGNAVNMFPNARGLGVTATPVRADGKGLGRHADGVFDIMVQGPAMKYLIDSGWLTKYRIFAPHSDIQLNDIPISANGDYSPPKLADAVKKSHIVGDVVAHYKRIAMGKLGVTFCVSVESATEMAQAYRASGVPAEVITGETPPLLRQHILQQFKARIVLNLVSIDIFSEGYDLPAIEVISFARPTQSYGLFVQQFGRGLRILEGKTHAIIIDHVNSCLTHGLPDAPRIWSLDRREKRSSGKPADDVIPLRTCLNPECLTVYERIHAACPECGTIPVPAARGTPEAVDGALAEFSPELLARLRGEIDKPLTIPYGAEPAVVGACKKRHRERTEAQDELRRVMAVWGGWRVLEGDTDDMQQRRFFLTMGVDVMSAQALNRADADALRGRVCSVLTNASIVWEDTTSHTEPVAE